LSDLGDSQSQPSAAFRARDVLSAQYARLEHLTAPRAQHFAYTSSSESETPASALPAMADGGRRILSSAGLVAADLSALSAHSPDVNSRRGDAARRPRRRPGAYTKTDLAVTSRKMATPAGAIPLISQRRGQALRDALAAGGAASLASLRGNVLRKVFLFLEERREILV